MKGERSATEQGKVVTDLRFFVAHIGDKVSKAELYCMYNCTVRQCTVHTPNPFIKLLVSYFPALTISHYLFCHISFT